MKYFILIGIFFCSCAFVKKIPSERILIDFVGFSGGKQAGFSWAREADTLSVWINEVQVLEKHVPKRITEYPSVRIKLIPKYKKRYEAIVQEPVINSYGQLRNPYYYPTPIIYNGYLSQSGANVLITVIRNRETYVFQSKGQNHICISISEDINTVRDECDLVTYE